MAITLRRKLGAAIYIGRGITVHVSSINADTGEVALEIDAPANVAISKDDFPYAVHLEFQRARELGKRIDPETAIKLATKRTR